MSNRDTYTLADITAQETLIDHLHTCLMRAAQRSTQFRPGSPSHTEARADYADWNRELAQEQKNLESMRKGLRS